MPCELPQKRELRGRGVWTKTAARRQIDIHPYFHPYNSAVRPGIGWTPGG